MRQYSCGILPTFLSLEAHQGKIISYVTAIWKPQWDFQITVTAKKCFAFHSLYNFKRSPLNLIIITHLCYKTMLRVNQGSSWGKEQSTCTIVELCVRFCQILELLSRVREREKVCVRWRLYAKPWTKIIFYKEGNLIVSELRIQSPPPHHMDCPHSYCHSIDYKRLKIHKARGNSLFMNKI